MVRIWLGVRFIVTEVGITVSWP